MKRSLVLKGLIAILIVLIFSFSAVSCIDLGGLGGDGSDGGNEEVVVDKDALLEELELEITSQGDYTAESYAEYAEALAEAKRVAADEEATQDEVDDATDDLTDAREALAVRPIKAVAGANKEISLMSGENKEIALADYVNTNGLSKITYKVLANNDAVTLGEIADGKFTITAGEVSGTATVKVAINVYYNSVPKLTLELSVKITNDVAPTVGETELVREVDLLDLANKESLVIDFAENVSNPCDLTLTYSVKRGDETLTLDGSTYTLALGTYTEAVTYETFTVTITCSVNGKETTVEYTYKLGIKDTSKYSVVNGGFENGLEGWTAVSDNENPFGAIDNKSTFWAQEFPMFNVGEYFSSEGSDKGSLASSYFTVNSDYATYMLGASGKANVYITIEDKDGNVLALYRNTKFADLPAGVEDWDEQRQLIGVSVFVCNFVTYKVDISAFKGQEIRFVIHDHEEGNGGFGFVLFDELNTYHTTEPEGVLAENLLANKDALIAELALEVAEQGDYTKESHDAYFVKLDAAKALLGDVAVAQATVDEAVAALTEARLALATRPVEEIAGATKEFRLISGNSQEISLADYINTNGLGGITYSLRASSTLVTLSEIADGKFTMTAGEASGASNETVSIIVSHNGEEKLTVVLSLEITNDLSPVVLESEITCVYDAFEAESVTLDLSENIDNVGNLTLTYSVNGNAVEGASYTFNFGTYTDEVVYETLTVTVSYVANGEAQSVSYTYKLGLKDSTNNRLVNGGFENGLEGWTVVGNIGNVSSDTHYWLNDPEVAEGYAFGMDGEKMFSAYAPGALESAVGTLTSSTFKLGGSGFVSYKVGAMKDGNYVYIDVVDAETKEILARFYNGLWSERVDEVKSGCTLISYKADLSAFVGKEVFFRISDNADSGYGLFFADSFVTYYESEPDGFNAATPVSYTVSGTIYDVFNGGFELGDVQGWWNNGEIGVVTNATGYWADNIPYGKVGEYLFTGVESFGEGVDTMREANRGVLTSSAFELGGTGKISFMLGGGGNVLCYVQVIDAVTGEVLARYRQQAQEDAKLIQYVADLSAHIGKTVRIQVVDQADSGWGCVSFDNLVTYYPAGALLPEGALTAEDIKGNLKYTIDNGSFESGNLDGWTMEITEEGTQNTLGWVLDTEIDTGWYTKNDDRKDGSFLFTFVQPDDTNCESSKGTLKSSTFSLKQGSFVSFKFGGAGTREVYVQLCRADGSVIATFYNEAEGKANTEMYSYYYQYQGVEVECFFRVVDNSTSNYGCFVVDDFRVNLEAAPEDYLPAIQ